MRQAFWTLVVVAHLLPSSALGQTHERVVATVREHDDSARLHFSRGEYAEALAEMQAAEALLPATSRLYNMAMCHERLGQHQRALILYRRFVDATDAQGERRARALERIDVLHDAEDAPIQPPQEDPAEYPAEDPIPEDPPEEMLQTPQPQAPAEEGPRGLPRAAFFSGLALTLATGVTFVALGSVTLVRHNHWEKTYEDDAQVDEYRQRGQSLYRATNAFLGVFAAAAAATLVLAFFTRWSDEPPVASVAFAPSPGGGQLALSGRF